MTTTTAPHSRPRRRSVRSRAVAVMVAAGFVSSLLAAVPSFLHPAEAAGGAAPNSMAEIGVMRSTIQDTTGSGTQDPPGLIVDEEHNLGFAFGQKVGASSRHFVMYDLEDFVHPERPGGPELASKLDSQVGMNDLNSDEIYTFAIDPDTQRVVFPTPGSVGTNAVCVQPRAHSAIPSGAGLNSVAYAYDRSTGQASLTHRVFLIPCSGKRSPFISALSIYTVGEGDDRQTKLLALGTYGTEGARYSVEAAGLIENLGSPLIVRQYDLGKIYESTLTSVDPSALEWEIDLRLAGCGRFATHLVERVGDDIVTFCSDPKPVIRSGVGEQGYVVRIPLDAEDDPLTDGGRDPAPDPTNPDNAAFVGNAVVRRTPALAGDVLPFIDHASGRVLLLTAGDSNGNAVWVFDADEERFVGVMTGGVVGQVARKTAAGFDPINGRAYLLTQRGILAASVRPSPLPGGQVYGVVDGVHDQAGEEIDPEVVSYPGIGIAVAPKLRRLFVPVVGKGGYVVVEDALANPTIPVPSDPDEFTNQIDEEPGKTEVNASGAAIATGARLLTVGGAPRIVNQFDPFCHDPAVQWQVISNQFSERTVFGNGCLADQAATPGNRDVRVASGEITTSLGSDAAAESSGVAFAETDHATDNDIKELGDCGYGYMERLQKLFEWMSRQDDDPSNDHSAQSPRGQDEGFCDGVQGGLSQALGGDDLRNGTSGGQFETEEEAADRLEAGEEPLPPGEGFPVPRSECNDFGNQPTSDAQNDEQLHRAKGLASQSSVACDAATSTAAAVASANGLVVPDSPIPIVSGRTWTDVTTTKGTEGQVTTAVAVAEGVTVGPLQIGELRSWATSKARGRTGTAEVEYGRRWCRVTLDTDGLPTPPEEVDDDSGAPELEDLGGPALLAPGCIDPDDADSPAAQELRTAIDDLNQALGKVRITIPEPNRTVLDGGTVLAGQATPGGYQAVLTKNSGVRAADQAVNDDDSHTVPALQVTVYNDGPEGRNRLIAQFAGVHTEARYGIVPLPQFTIPDFPDFDTLPDIVRYLPAVPATPATTRYEIIESGVSVLPARQTAPAPQDEVPFFATPADVLQRLLRWLTQSPIEAALLFLLFTILASPIYLIIRSRAAARELGL